MQNELKKLVELQEIDMEIEKIREKFSSLPEKLEKKRKDILILEKELDEQKTELDKLRDVFNAKDSEQKIEKDRYKNLETNLRQIKTNREFNAISREMGFAKKAVEEFDNELEDILGEIEGIESFYNEKLEIFNSLKANADELEEEVIKQTKIMEDELKDHINKRAELSKNINEELFNEYEKLKTKLHLPIVAKVEDEICQGCFMNIPPQLFIQVQRSAIIKEESKNIFHCPNCMRIIYFIPEIEE